MEKGTLLVERPISDRAFFKYTAHEESCHTLSGGFLYAHSIII